MNIDAQMKLDELKTNFGFGDDVLRKVLELGFKHHVELADMLHDDLEIVRFIIFGKNKSKKFIILTKTLEGYAVGLYEKQGPKDVRLELYTY